MPKLLKLFNKDQLKYFYLLLVLICFVSVLEMASLAIIIPILNSFLEIENSQNEISLSWVTEFLNIDSSLTFFLFIFLFFFIVKTFFSIFVSWKYHNFIFDFIKNLSFNLYSKYLSQSFQLYSKKNTSELLRNALKEIDLFYLYLQSFIQIILESIILIGISIFLIYILTIPTLVIIGLSSCLSLTYYFFVKNKISSWGRNRQVIEEDRIRYMQEGFSSIKEINFFNRNNFFLNRFKEKNDKFYKIYINFNFLNTLPRYIFELFIIILIALIFLFLMSYDKENDEIIKILALFFAASFRIIPSVYRIFSGLQHLKYSHASIHVLYHDLLNLETRASNNYKSKIVFKDKINFKIDNFIYDYDSSFKIKNIKIDIFKNEKIGFIGKSGSGKSTILDIFSNVIDSCKNSEIIVDGVKLKNKSQLRDWQKLIGLIPQNISILNVSLKDNILFGLSDKNISDDQIIETIKVCNLTNLLSRLPQGIHEEINEKGSNLSGGEIQRIGIARALIFNPEILIFDEATSALDTFTENEILRDINSLPNKTVLMISHRMNTLKNCDRVFLIDKGEIRDHGSYTKFNQNL